MGASPEGNGGKTGKLPAWGPTHEDRNGQPCLTNLAVDLKNTCMLTLILFVTTILILQNLLYSVTIWRELFPRQSKLDVVVIRTAKREHLRSCRNNKEGDGNLGFTEECLCLVGGVNRGRWYLNRLTNTEVVQNTTAVAAGTTRSFASQRNLGFEYPLV